MRENHKKDNLSIMFESKRCYAREFTYTDIPDFMVCRNDMNWMKHQGFKGLLEKEYEEALLRNTSLDEGIQFAVIRKEDDRLIGDLYVKKDGSDYWIGYTVNPSYKKMGYTSGIVISMIKWIKDQGGARVLAEVDSDNIPSIGFLEKMGFARTKEDDKGIIYTLQCR